MLWNADFFDFSLIDLTSIDWKKIAAQRRRFDAIIQRKRRNLQERVRVQGNESASMPQKYSLDATLMPAFSVSALPPFSLSTTMRPGIEGLV